MFVAADRNAVFKIAPALWTIDNFHERLTVHELATMPHYHPSLADFWSYPAEELAEKIPAK